MVSDLSEAHLYNERNSRLLLMYQNCTFANRVDVVFSRVTGFREFLILSFSYLGASFTSLSVFPAF